MQTTRPVFLELRQIRLPISGVVSILHRLTGIAMVLAIPIGAALFHQALAGPEGFAATTDFLDSWLVRLILLGMTWSLLHHLVAGVRFLLLDLGIGLDRPLARRSAWIALVGALAALVVLLGLGGLSA